MTRPVVLFACVHNAGRSLAAKVLTDHHGAGRVEARSAGSAPGAQLNQRVVAVLRERGLDTSGEVPKLLTRQAVRTADVVVTMGCGESCPVVEGGVVEDWAIDDPREAELPAVRRIVEEIDVRVRDLLVRLLGPPPPDAAGDPGTGPAAGGGSPAPR